MKQQTLAMAADPVHPAPPRTQTRPATPRCTKPAKASNGISARHFTSAWTAKVAWPTAVVTAANIHDKHPLPDLLHGNEQRVYGDAAYASQKTLIASKAPKARDFTNQRTRRAGGVVDEVERGKNRDKLKIRARVEHVFGVVKRLWGFGKVRYRGLNKNATRAFTALALANIYLARQRLMAQYVPKGGIWAQRPEKQPKRAAKEVAFDFLSSKWHQFIAKLCFDGTCSAKP
jgi:IS5 family transposase